MPKKNHVELREIKNPNDINFGHLDFVTTFGKELLKGKECLTYKPNVFSELIDVNTNVSGDIVITIKNVWKV